MLSGEAESIIRFMLKEISSLTHAPREMISGCYDMSIENYGFAQPLESKVEIIDRVIDILHEIQKD